MKKILIEIDETFFPKLLALLKKFPKEKIKISFENTEKKQKLLSYEEFAQKWAGILSEEDLKNLKEQRISYLLKKHS